MTTTLILIRHGQTNKNGTGVIHLVGDPEPLNKHGVEQISKAAQKLLGKEIVKVYSSAEFRAIQSAKIIARLHSTPFSKTAALGERNWGHLQSKPWEEIEAILKTMPLEKRHTFKPTGGESWQEFENRLLKALSRILAKHQGKTIAVISHGGALRAMMPTLLGIPKEKRFDYFFDNGSISEFEFDGKSFKKVKLNETSHLN